MCRLGLGWESPLPHLRMWWEGQDPDLEVEHISGLGSVTVQHNGAGGHKRRRGGEGEQLMRQRRHSGKKRWSGQELERGSRGVQSRQGEREREIQRERERRERSALLCAISAIQTAIVIVGIFSPMMRHLFTRLEKSTFLMPTKKKDAAKRTREPLPRGCVFQTFIDLPHVRTRTKYRTQDVVKYPRYVYVRQQFMKPTQRSQALATQTQLNPHIVS